MTSAFSDSNGYRRHRGFVYVMVLGVAMIVTMIGLSAITLVRIEGRGTIGERDLAEAAIVAFSGLEHAVTTIDQTSNWRTQFLHGVTVAEFPLGRGTFSWLLLDEVDGDLANDATQSVVVVTTGVVNDATYTTRVQLDSDIAEGKMYVKLGSRKR